jgi:nucleotide-binding universal stress UspA family protein
MKKILVPCDFSKPAINAFRFAIDLARQSGGSVHLLNVIELPVLHDTLIMPVLNFEQELLDDLKEKAQKSLTSIIEKCDPGNLVVKSAVAFGSVHRKIQEYILEQNIDLVVMGSHETSGAREFFIGSNAERIVRHSTVPVLVLKDYYKGPVKNIIFPNMLNTEHQEDLILRVKALQNFFGAHLHLVWINTPLNFTADDVTLKRLEAFAKRFMLKNYTLNIVNDIDTERGILQFAKRVGGDLIAMATHGRRGVSHLIYGSLAEDVVNHTKGLVWTYALKQETVEA